MGNKEIPDAIRLSNISDLDDETGSRDLGARVTAAIDGLSFHTQPSSNVVYLDKIIPDELALKRIVNTKLEEHKKRGYRNKLVISLSQIEETEEVAQKDKYLFFVNNLYKLFTSTFPIANPVSKNIILTEPTKRVYLIAFYRGLETMFQNEVSCMINYSKECGELKVVKNKVELAYEFLKVLSAQWNVENIGQRLDLDCIDSQIKRVNAVMKFLGEIKKDKRCNQDLYTLSEIYCSVISDEITKAKKDLIGLTKHLQGKVDRCNVENPEYIKKLERDYTVEMRKKNDPKEVDFRTYVRKRIIEDYMLGNSGGYISYENLFDILVEFQKDEAGNFVRDVNNKKIPKSHLKDPFYDIIFVKSS